MTDVSEEGDTLRLGSPVGGCPLKKGLEGGVRDNTLLQAAGHVFHDGNERTSHAVAAVFLDLNGWSHEADEADVVRRMIGVAAGSIKEAALATWFRKTSTKA